MDKGDDGKGKKAEEQKQKQAQLKKTAQSGLQNVLKQSSFFGGALALGAGLLNPGLGGAALAGAQNFPGMSGKDKGKGTLSSGFFGGALKLAQTSGIADMGQKLLKGGSNIVDIAKTLPKAGGLTNPAMLAASVIPGAASMFGAPANAAAAPKPQEQKKDDGGWFGKAMSFGGSLIDKAKDAGTSAIKSANEFGNSVKDTAGHAYNGAAKWVGDHKAEIAIGVGVVALAAATILTGGAALAVVGAVGAGGLGALATASTATALGVVALGGVGVGAGLNLALQGKQIQDGIVDPATGKKKSDIAWGDVGKSGLVGGVAAPLAAVSFGLAPAALGTWAGKGAVIGGGTDFAAQMATNHGDVSKLDFVSIAGSTAAGALGGGLGSGVSRMTAGIAGKTIGSSLLGIGTRATLNSAGSGLIGGGVTLGQNAFNQNVLGKNVGLWDNVENNAVLSAKLGAAGSFIGDSVEVLGKRGSQAYSKFLSEQAWKGMTLEQKLWSTSNAITSYVKPSNMASIAGTTISNTIANSAPTISIIKDILSPPNKNQ